MEGVRKVDESTGFTGWFLATMGGIGTLLSGIIAKFYHAQVKSYELRITELVTENVAKQTKIDKCDEEREGLRVRCAVIESQHEALKLRVDDLELRKQNRSSIDRGHGGTA